MFNLDMVYSSIANGFIQGFLYIRCGHGGEQLPNDDVSGKVIQNS